MSDEMIEMIRQQTEKKMEDMMQAKRERNAEPINAHTPSTPVPSHYEIAQTYLLLKILDRLESIDDSLIVLMKTETNK